MPLITLEEEQIERIVPVFDGKFHARITYSLCNWSVKERRCIVMFHTEIGQLVNELDEEDEVINTTFVPIQSSLFKQHAPESFIADDNTWVNPETGAIIKYANQAPTRAMEELPYALQFNWFQYMSSKPIAITSFIGALIDQKLANNEFDFQKS